MQKKFGKLSWEVILYLPLLHELHRYSILIHLQYEASPMHIVTTEVYNMYH